MTWVIRIDTDGNVERCQGAHLVEEARAHFRLLDLLSPPEVEVVSLRMVSHPSHPIVYPGCVPLVGAVHQWSRVEGFPVNVKGWAIYGYSPLCGPVFVARDGDGVNRPALDDEWIDTLAEDGAMIPTWVPAELEDHMRLRAREDGAVWP